MTSRQPFVPASEAAYIGGVHLREVNRLVDEDLVPKSLYLQEGGTRRFTRLAGPFARFYCQAEATLQAKARRRILFELVERVEQSKLNKELVFSLRCDPSAMDWKVIVDAKLGHQIDFFVLLTDAMVRAKAVDSAEQLVSEDPEVMGGQPCFAGTRVPIDIVLASLDKGIARDRLVASYPFLTDAHIEAARVYQQVHPRRGRPPRLRELNPTATRKVTRVVRPGRA
jgi:uncharacterized protein (DUF433 family)